MEGKCYAVRHGRNPGIYDTWDQCKKQVIDFPGASFKKFTNRKDAEKFLHDFSYDPSEDTEDWKQTGHELVRNLLADAEKQGGILETISEPIIDSSSIKSYNRDPPKYRINVWISGSAEGNGCIVAYFSDSNPLNRIGVFPRKKPIEKVRICLTSISAAISSVLQEIHCKKLQSNDYSLVIHTDNRYVRLAIMNFLKGWPRIPDDKNTDIYTFLHRQLASTRLRIICVMESDKNNENMKAANELAMNFTDGFFMERETQVGGLLPVSINKKKPLIPSIFMSPQDS